MVAALSGSWTSKIGTKRLISEATRYIFMRTGEHVLRWLLFTVTSPIVLRQLVMTHDMKRFDFLASVGREFPAHQKTTCVLISIGNSIEKRCFF